ncbi:TPA: hypothetical protein ACPXHA_002101 [Streptococcus pneumoniae]
MCHSDDELEEFKNLFLNFINYLVLCKTLI